MIKKYRIDTKAYRHGDDLFLENNDKILSTELKETYAQICILRIDDESESTPLKISRLIDEVGVDKRRKYEKPKEIVIYDWKCSTSGNCDECGESPEDYWQMAMIKDSLIIKWVCMNCLGSRVMIK